jgi:Fibronectin type III domain
MRIAAARGRILGALVAATCLLGIAPPAGAATPTRLYLSQGAAFSILGHSCGGIQEEVWATGFAPNGFPAGDVYMKTRCGGSGRGGGYKVTTYSAWASTTWDWFANTRSYARLEGAAEGIGPSFSAEDAFGNRVYNEGPAAYLEANDPQYVPPAAPSGVTAGFWPIEQGEEEVLRFQVSWTPATETAGLITSSTVTATPLGGSKAPALTATASGSATSVFVGPLAPHTSYSITVTNTDGEGTSAASEAVEAYSEGVKPPPPAYETCELSQGTIKLSPGLTETPHVQTITVKGTLKECGGQADVEEATYVAHLKTSEEVTCSALQSASEEPTTTPTSLVVKWTPHEEFGNSTGQLVLPLTETAYGSLSGTIEAGPFKEPLSISAASVWESFTGGGTCGVPVGKKKAKAVKSGTFTTSPLEIGG